MPSAIQSAVRAVAEGAVERIAAWNRKRLPRTEASFVVGIHKPMPSELTLKDLAVTGSIPAGLNGRYLKMGANPVSPDPLGHHWFLGDGMVHGLAIQDGKALWYRNRWIRSRLAATAERVTERMEDYDTTFAGRAIAEFVDAVQKGAAILGQPFPVVGRDPRDATLKHRANG